MKGYEVLRMKIDEVDKSNPVIVEAEVDLLAQELTNIKIITNEGGITLHEAEISPLATILMEIQTDLDEKNSLSYWKNKIKVKNGKKKKEG